MLILGIHSGYHDACAALFDDYRMVAAVAQERLTRRKLDGGRIPDESIDEVLAIAGATRADVEAVALSHAAFPARYYMHLSLDRRLERAARAVLGREKMKSMERELARAGTIDATAIFDGERFKAEMGFRPRVPIGFYNHHLAHALPCLFHTDWEEALLYTSDGGGDNVQYSHRVFKDGAIATLDGGEDGLLAPLRIDSLGLAYGFATQALGWKINRHEGKLTGLSAAGEPRYFSALAAHFRVDAAGRIASDFASYGEMRRLIFALAEGARREDIAASVQKLLEDFTLEAVERLLSRHRVRRLGLAGGVFANVLLNQKLALRMPIDEIFVYPAMSDQGLAAGGVLAHLLRRDGIERWLASRAPLETLYFGRDYTDEIDRAFAADPRFSRIAGEPVETAARLLENGAVVALFIGRMEYGPRALGARSILASPHDARINHDLNTRLARSEFMPFAPVVAEEDADELFDLPTAMRVAARFMTVTCAVRPAWRERIPAVVHIDGTARPQLVRRADNPLYYDILARFKQLTGMKALINTSFNVHEEPIINTPAECLRALADRRIDCVVTETGVWSPRAE